MLFSTKGRYALRAVVDIAENDAFGRVSLKSVAERQCLSSKYLEALAKPLVNAGILSGTRGKGGGYCLARPADQITAGDVVRAVEGELVPAPCTQPDGVPCEREQGCRTSRFWAGLEQTIADYLDNHTIADLKFTLTLGE